MSFLNEYTAVIYNTCYTNKTNFQLNGYVNKQNMAVLTKGISLQYMNVIALTDNHDVVTLLDPSFAIIEMTVIGYVSFKTSQSLCRRESKFKELLHATEADLKYKQIRYGTYFMPFEAFIWCDGMFQN